MWIPQSSEIEDHVREEARRTLAAYGVQPNLVREHSGIEEEILSGGYGHRQIHELVQNAADAISDAGIVGRVHVVLTADALYCANEGSPIDIDGVNAILGSHISRKHGNQIGQFGLGFKSVLAISTCPEFHCCSGSFSFHRQWSADQIRNVLPNVEQIPVLRLARVIAPPTAEEDRSFAELAKWATTVVKLPRDIEGTDWLSQDLEAFPREFLLFSAQVRELVLDDRVSGRVRRILAKQDGDRVVLLETGEEEAWTVFTRQVSIKTLGTRACADADRMTRERAFLPLLWAVPHDGRRSRGKFWAFFPTETETTLTGIVNAPWKTNADRQNLLDGPFNRALIGETVGLVTGSLCALCQTEDPGCVLDLLPARAADSAGWADKALIEALEPALGVVPCVPNTAGKLTKPHGLQMRPDEALTPTVAELLASFSAGMNDTWVHPTVERRERRAKAERLGVKKSDANAWLESLAAPASPESSVRAILVVGSIEREMNSRQLDSLRNARIILTAAGELVNARFPSLFLPSPQDESAHPLEPVVHREVASDPEARAVLRALKVPEQSAIARLETMLAGDKVDWVYAWGCLHELPFPDALAILEKHRARNPVHVRTLAGSFKRLGTVLLPGRIVPPSGERDSDVGIDVVFHHQDEGLLQALGVGEVPVPGRDEKAALWFGEYLQRARRRLIDSLKGGSKPDPRYLSFHQSRTVGPLDPLASLSETGRVIMTDILLPYLNEEPWVLRHMTRPGAYPTIRVESPVIWMLRRYGRLLTSLGPRPIANSVGAFFLNWKAIFPVASVDPGEADVLQLPSSWDGLKQEHWAAAFEEVQRVDDDLLVGRLYREAVQHIEAPHLLWCRRGDERVALSPSKIYVAPDAGTARAHHVANVPSVTAPDRATLELLVERWGMQKSAGTIRYSAVSDECPLADTLPGLRRYVPEEFWATPLLPCEELWLEFPGDGSPTAEPLRSARVGSQLLVLASMTPIDLLSVIASELGVTLSLEQLQEAHDYARREGRQHLVDRVRGISGIAEKLSALVDMVGLLDGLPSSVQSSLCGDSRESILLVAQAALAIYGVDVLQHYADAIAAGGLEPPARWNGSPRALEFVDDLGFPAEYAGFQRVRRDPSMDVDGPIELNQLHEFQALIETRIREFLGKPKPERGLLSLPTGSGKTRVVVQAVVEAIRQGVVKGPVIWVAQSDELCEQAVQSWAQVWRAFGQDRRLRVSRLWGQTNNRVVEASAPHVVVATYQSLLSRLRLLPYRWLLDASCIIIDEAHGSIAPSYTEILEMFGLTSRQTARPLIGLTATPFRSARDPSETQWLVNRYGQQRFDHGAIPGDDPYSVLQDMGVLARVDQQVLPGSELSLNALELQELTQFKRLPASAELRLGEMQPRNARIVESIKALPGDWPVLLFATSVEQADLMAALLSIEGVSCKAISGRTDHGARRHYIEEFRRGRIRVLSNYNVLSTGFDAPSLRALYIVRPVYSPVLYQQMLGRGLRGPLNGGKDRCLVVNVEDNISEFGEKLAFHHFEYLWRPAASGRS